MPKPPRSSSPPGEVGKRLLVSWKLWQASPICLGVTALPLDRPEGAQDASPGQRPGGGETSGVGALKGRNNPPARLLFRPCRAGVRCYNVGPKPLPGADVSQPFRLKSGRPVTPV